MQLSADVREHDLQHLKDTKKLMQMQAKVHELTILMTGSC
jgi:hypothetical protein